MAEELTQEMLVEQRVIGHGEGQEHAIADVNAGLIDDLIEPRLRPFLTRLYVESIGEGRVIIGGQPYVDERLVSTNARLQPYAQHQARLDVFNEIHQHWEFADLSEEEFDAWMHEQIKAEMKALKEGDLRPAEKA